MRPLLPLMILLSCLAVSSCQVNYYTQALAGQLEVVTKQKPVKLVLKKSATREPLRTNLLLIQNLLEFAETELLLPADGNYSHYADLNRDFVLWSVFATPELSSEAIEWTYPIFGGLEYRGYFREAAAEAYALKLRSEGHDVAVAGVPAYSTLGWFRDPVLNTFVDWDEDEIAALIFHELAHKKYYRHGDTEFSESFAVAVEQEGVRRWFLANDDAKALCDYESSLKRMKRFTDRILRERNALSTIYTSSLSDEVKRAKKEARLSELQSYIRNLLRAAGRTEEDTFWLRDQLNNAHLNIVATYHEGVPLFEQLLSESSGDLAIFYERVKEL